MAYRASALRGLAVSQMVFGVLMILFGVASIFVVGHWSSDVGFGIWVGIWILIAGILGFIGAKDHSTPNKCLLGCFMGFSITACVITGIMFICYCVAVGEFANILRCRRTYNNYYGSYHHYHPYCYSSRKRLLARIGAGVGSCLLIFSLVEFFVALASSIYCCTGICCKTTAGAVGSSVTNQQVVYLQPQQTYPGAQGGMIIIQPSGAMTTMPQGYPVTAQQPGHLTHQAGAYPQQPAYWAVPSGSNPAGTVTVSYAGATGGQVQNPGQAQFPEKPPPYSYPQTGNAPPSAASSGDTPSEAAPVDV